MKITQDLLEEVVAKVGPEFSEREKAQCEQLIKEIAEGKSPKEALGFTPEMLGVMYGGAQRLYNTGKYSDAKLVFFLLTLIDDQEPKYYMGAAAALHMQKNYGEALTFYTSSVHLDPSNPIPAYHAADCFVKINDPATALLFLSLAMARAGDDPKYAKLKERAKMMQDTLIEEYKKTMPLNESSHQKQNTNTEKSDV